LDIFVLSDTPSVNLISHYCIVSIFKWFIFNYFL